MEQIEALLGAHSLGWGNSPHAPCRVDASRKGRAQSYQESLGKFHRIQAHLQCPTERTQINNVDQDQLKEKASGHGKQPGAGTD